VTRLVNIYKNGLQRSGKSPLFCIYCPSTVTGKRVSQSPLNGSQAIAKGSLQVTRLVNIYKNGLRRSGKSPLFCIYCPSTVTGKGVSQSPLNGSQAIAKGSLQVTRLVNIYKNGLRRSGKSPLFCIYCPPSVTGKGVSQSPLNGSQAIEKCFRRLR